LLLPIEKSLSDMNTHQFSHKFPLYGFSLH
jgi:hypothetical protein